MRALELISVEVARARLFRGDVIAYPTEAVYGLGCDIFNQGAVLRILEIKKRPESKGLIVLVADWEQLELLIDKNLVPKARLAMLEKTWPGPVTWVFPASKQVPKWVRGEHDSIAVRMSAHPVAHALCQNGPIISTSANLSGAPPARDLDALSALISEDVAGVVTGELGERSEVSEIYNILDGLSVRTN